MRFFFSDDYDYGRGLPLRRVHGFVLDKPSQIRGGLMRELGLDSRAFEAPPPLDEGALEAVHTEALLDGLKHSRSIARAAELPPIALLPSFVVRRAVVAPQVRATSGTCAALAAAVDGEWAVNLSGGYHHARPALSHGFCLVNDVAMAVHTLRESGDAETKVLVLDLDLHQGDGNAVAFEDDPTVFTASLHEEDTFPFPKMRSDLDVGLAAKTGDEAYLAALDRMLARIARRFTPDVLIYVAGSDPFRDDPLGSLTLSRAGMLARDERVGRFALEQDAGLVALPAGGYCDASPSINAAGFAALASMAP